MKRLFDIVASALGLILLSPLFLVLAIWIKADSEGPVFYRQVRVGRYNRDFRIFKFRSMRAGSDTGSLITIGGRDPRITRSGYLIRKFKLDELPQLINVFVGDMSLVGPRPEVRHYVNYWTAEQMHVLDVRPGITDEYYILENRCQSGWDYGVPGNGLLICHVDYDPIAWSDNVVNTQKDHFRYDLFHPDGKNYKDWDPAQNGKDMSKYTMDKRLRSSYLSTTTYPYVNPETGVSIQSLTDDTTPAATLFNANAAFEYKMSKPITNIQLADDGTVSFTFMGDGTAVKGVTTAKTGEAAVWYDLNGGRLSASPSRAGIFIRRNPDGTSRKAVIHK